MSGPPDDEPERDQADDAAGPRRDDELDAAEVEERFAALVANFESEPTEWPDDETRRDDEESDDELDLIGSEDTPKDTAVTDTRTEEPTLLELLDAEIPEDPDDEEEEYVPPPPPPLPVPSFPAVIGVLLILAGVGLIIWPTALDVGTNLGLATGIAAFIGGVLMLIWRLRPEPEDGEPDNDNGAVV